MSSNLFPDKSSLRRRKQLPQLLVKVLLRMYYRSAARLLAFGIEKSFISLFTMMPVSGTMRREPNVRLIVLVEEMARQPEASAGEI